MAEIDNTKLYEVIMDDGTSCTIGQDNQNELLKNQ